MEIFYGTFMGNSFLEYFISACILFAGYLVIRIISRVVIKQLKALSLKTKTTLDDFIVEVIEKIGAPMLYVAVLYVSLKRLVFPQDFEKFLNYAGLGVAIFFLARFIIMLINYSFSVYLKNTGEDVGLERSLNSLMVVVKAVVWGGAVIFFMDNLGLKISAVIAGLGIGGVAVALAAQTLLKDLFSYFSILFDKPFKVGDFIIVGDYLGTIEHVGIKTTRIRSLSGEMLIFSNSDLTDSRVRNYKLMERRRVVFSIGVEYQTPLEKMKEVPKIIEKSIKNIKDTVFDRAHFFRYGEFSLIYEIVYYVIGSDYNKYMNIQQEINFAIKEEFEKKKIEFAYLTHKFHVSK